MQVTFDGLTIGRRPSGTRTRLLALAPRLVRRGVEVAILCEPGDFPLAEVSEVTPPRWQRGRGHVGRWLRRHSMFYRVHREGNRVVQECLPWRGGKGMVGVIHDLRHLDVPGRRGRIAHGIIRRSLRGVEQVHVVSDATQDRLRAEFPDVDTPVHVVPNGTDLKHFTPAPDPRDLTILHDRRLEHRRYVLCVGHLEPRKAPDVVLAIRSSLAQRGIDMPVVFAGKGPFLPEEGLSYLRAEHPHHDVGRVYRDVGSDELPALYRNAACLIAPAREEGFGIVPLEAIACGAPVVASDIPAHLEVLGDAARFCRVDDVTGFTSAVLDVIEGRDDQRLRDAGPPRASVWTWDRAADAFVAALSS